MKSNSGPSIVWRELNFYVYSNRVVFRSRVVEFTNKQSAIKLFLLFIHEYTKKHNPDEFATVHHDCCGGFFHFSEEKEVVRLFLSPCLSRKSRHRRRRREEARNGNFRNFLSTGNVVRCF